MTLANDKDRGDSSDGHGDYEHVRPARTRVRLGVVIFGGILIAAVVGGMFLY